MITIFAWYKCTREGYARVRCEKKKIGVPRKHVRDEKCDVFSSDLT
jgi:hypothetical protein